MTKDQEHKVQSLLLKEPPVSPQQIAAELNVSYAGVLRVRRELNEALDNKAVESVLDVDRYVVEELAKDLPVDASQTLEKINGLQTLQEEFQNTARLINTRVRSLLMSAEHPSELQVYAEILCDLQGAFFNKNTTQVNVQNNFGETNEQSGPGVYAEFLGDSPGRTD